VSEADGVSVDSKHDGDRFGRLSGGLYIRRNLTRIETSPRALSLCWSWARVSVLVLNCSAGKLDVLRAEALGFIVSAANCWRISYASDFNIYCNTNADSNNCHQRFSSAAPNKRMFYGKMR
jgi:hypothetical protein